MSRRRFLYGPERRAAWALLAIMTVVLLVLSLRAWRAPEESMPVKSAADAPQHGGITYAAAEDSVETFPFDPNTADSTTLLRLGLAPWQVRAVYRYRAKHGRYHVPEDFMRLPGMTNGLWQRLKPMVQIAEEFRYVTPPAPSRPAREAAAPGSTPPADTAQTTSGNPMPARRDSLPRQEKLAAGEVVDINTADTTLLKKIPGIASRRAARIVRYRQQLGGFVSTEQVMEATELPDSVMLWMTVVPGEVQKIAINAWSVQRLMRHPYLNFYQAKDIQEYRRNHGDLHSVEELSQLEHFRPTDIDRLRPYVAF